MNGSKRKQLAVPMVALMVCAVAFIGIGYALTSSFETTDNSIAGDKLEVTMAYASGTSAIFTSTEARIPYSTHYIDGEIDHYSTETATILNKVVNVVDQTNKYNKYKIEVSIKVGGNSTICGIDPNISITNNVGSDGELIIEKAHANDSYLTITLPGTETVSKESAGTPAFNVSDITVTIEVTGLTA